MLNCQRMRTAVILSAALFALGFALEGLIQMGLVGAPMSYLALLIVLSAAGVLGLTFVASLLPKTARRLRECAH